MMPEGAGAGRRQDYAWKRQGRQAGQGALTIGTRDERTGFEVKTGLATGDMVLRVPAARASRMARRSNWRAEGGQAGLGASRRRKIIKDK
jgi:hypothetical protein